MKTKPANILLLMFLVLVLGMIFPVLANTNDPYADTVISYSLGPGVANAAQAPPNGNDNPSAALGAPEGIDVSGSGLFVSLGDDGWIILGFTDNLIYDGVGNDLRVYEVGAPEPGEIYASADGITFVYLGIANGTTSFDLASVGLSSAIAVKIVDISPYTSFPYAGFDVDAVEALNLAPPLPAVGGKATPINIPVNKPELLAPYIGLTMLLALAVATVVYVKKRKRNTEINS